MRRILLGLAIFGSVLTFRPTALSVALARVPAETGPAELKIGGAVTAPLVISAADLKGPLRTKLTVVNPHSNKMEVYEGVPLTALLQKAGVPQGGKIQGPWMAAYVMVEAADDYRAVFSLAELDSDFLDSQVLVADTIDGSPLGAGEGPLKLVVPHDKRPARWVRMLKSITVVQVPKP